MSTVIEMASKEIVERRLGTSIDIAGQKFGRLTAIKRVPKPKHVKNTNKCAYWLCQCECGNDSITTGVRLRYGDAKSCGCLKGKSHKIDLTGQKFGRLTVIEPALRPKTTKSRGTFWLCKCECGNQKVVPTTTLRGGACQSCGCLRRATAAKIGAACLKDLTGRNFGRLTVIERHGTRGGKTTWLCRCECGKTTTKQGSHLLGGKVKSCGCLQHDYIPNNFVDLTGKQIANYKVIRQVKAPNHFKNKTISYWLCKCDCGKEGILPATAIKTTNRYCRYCKGASTRLAKGVSALNRGYKRAQKRAEWKDVCFELSRKEWEELIFQPCFYCGAMKSNCYGSKNTNGRVWANGIDAYDNAKGYTLDNVVPCCRLCNRNKGKMNGDEFLEWVQRIQNHQKTKKDR